MNNFSHSGSLDAVLLDTKRGYEEQVHGFFFRHIVIRGGGHEPPIHYLYNVFFAAVGYFLAPLHYVHTLAKVSDRPSACQELQHHDAKAVHVTLLVHLQCVCILCIREIIQRQFAIQVGKKKEWEVLGYCGPMLLGYKDLNGPT